MLCVRKYWRLVFFFANHKIWNKDWQLCFVRDHKTFAKQFHSLVIVFIFFLAFCRNICQNNHPLKGANQMHFSTSRFFSDNWKFKSLFINVQSTFNETITCWWYCNILPFNAKLFEALNYRKVLVFMECQLKSGRVI